jgi:mono/diheme cytochrome c family protein
MRVLPLVVAASFASALAASCNRPVRTPSVAPSVAAAPAAPTFSETIAPIVYSNCVTCHRPGEAAPFPLISYEDVAKRGSLIAKVTASRYMPPWKAAHGYGEFKDERRLSDLQIASIGEWVKAGMPRGDTAKMPALPQFTDGWQLGKPDLILEMTAGYTVPATGADIYRNFVIPTGLTEDKWIRAIEFRPSARRVVHHAIFSYVRSGAVKNLEGRGGKPGFGGAMPVAFVPGFQPAGELAGWAVGTTPRDFPEGIARSLPKNSDLVVQLHFHPSGKEEMERSTIGLYFADGPPARRLVTPGIPGFFGALAGLDIAPGEKAFTITGSYTVPRDMYALSIAAHAHYLGKEFKVTATLPDASTKPLLWIQDWDFNWQDRYDYKEPILLPRGTKIDAVITYDNSAENPRNPCNPPRRVRWGVQSFDEMGSVNFMMIPAGTVSPEEEEKARQQMAAALKTAIGKVMESDAVKRYAAEQKRFMEDPTRDGADPCAAR